MILDSKIKLALRIGERDTMHGHHTHDYVQCGQMIAPRLTRCTRDGRPVQVRRAQQPTQRARDLAAAKPVERDIDAGHRNGVQLARKTKI